MTDILQKATLTLEQPNKVNFLKRTFLIGAIACSVLLIVSMTSTAPGKFATLVPVSSLDQEDQTYIETKGRQPIRSGCVNLYGSDWAMYPDTRAVVICNGATQGFMETQIDNIGFAHDSVNHGISYVETGAGASCTLYTQNDYMGSSLTIKPSSKVWLQQVAINGGSTMWNDKVRSVYFQGHSGDLISQIVDIFPGDIPAVGDHCASLYASDPHEQVGSKGTTCVIICGDPLQQNVWKFSYQYIKNNGYPLKFYSLGVSYISVGSQSSLQVFSGPNFDENDIYLKTGSDNDLTKIKYPEQGKFDGWNDKPMSFILTIENL